MKKNLLVVTICLFVMFICPALCFGQEVIPRDAVGDTLSRMWLLPERYVGKILYFEGVELNDVSKIDEENFCLRISKPSWRSEGTSYSAWCNDKLRFITSRQLAIKIIDAGRGVYLKKEDEKATYSPETVRLGCRISKSKDELLVFVFEVASEGFFNVSSAVSDDVEKSILFAAIRGDSYTINSLAETKNQANAVDNGKTALMIAAERGHEKTVKTLLAKGADPNAKSNNGKTALAYAREAGKKNIVKVLEKAGAKE